MIIRPAAQASYAGRGPLNLDNFRRARVGTGDRERVRREAGADLRPALDLRVERARRRWAPSKRENLENRRRDRL